MQITVTEIHKGIVCELPNDKVTNTLQKEDSIIVEGIRYMVIRKLVTYSSGAGLRPKSIDFMVEKIA